MTSPGKSAAHEIVTVVEHPAFANLYQEQLEPEGLFVEILDEQRVPKTTVSIYPSSEKDWNVLEIEIPSLSAGYRQRATLEALGTEDVRNAFSKFTPLPLGTATKQNEIHYEGRQLITDEVVERIKLHLPLLEAGTVGAISYYVKELEEICRVRGLHPIVAPLLEAFFTEILFTKRTYIEDVNLASRLGDSDVEEHVRAVFVPLIRERTIIPQPRQAAGDRRKLSSWRPYQATHSASRPAIEANGTLFNLVPCNRQLEVAFTGFLDKASDVIAFAKNAGPQCLRIDYVALSGNLAFYTPDFFARTADGACYLVETKGQEDVDVPRKAKAAIAWCEAATKAGAKWSYLYVPQEVFGRATATTLRELARVCAPALQELLSAIAEQPDLPLFAGGYGPDHEDRPELDLFAAQPGVQFLPERYRKAARVQAARGRF